MARSHQSEAVKRNESVVKRIQAQAPDKLSESGVQSMLRELTGMCAVHATPHVQSAVFRASALNDWSPLLDCDVDPFSFTSADEFRWSAQTVNLTKKLERVQPWPTTINSRQRKEAALRTEQACQEWCDTTNVRLHDYVRNGNSDRLLPRPRWLVRAQQIVREVLGKPFSHSDLSVSFGPGATSTNTGFHTCLLSKLSGSLEMYPGSFEAVRTLFANSTVLTDLMSAAYPDAFEQTLVHPEVDIPGPPVLKRLLSKSSVTFLNNNRFSTVAKTVKTDRGIAIEAHWSSVIQRAIGAVISRRLAAYGLEKEKTDKRHRAFMPHCQRFGCATVDGESASSLISTKCVELLLAKCHPSWIKWLYSCRAPMTQYEKGGSLSINHTFSTMGNGYTFELETVLFYAVGRACSELAVPCGPTVVSAFGDDLIIPSAAYEQYLEAVEFLGWRVNTKKSFATGPFRESCGIDVFNGSLTRSVYAKKMSTIADLVSLHNRFVRQYSAGGVLDNRVIPILKRIVGEIPKPYRRAIGPDHDHDMWLIDWRLDKDTNTAWIKGSGRVNLYLKPLSFTMEADRWSELTRYTSQLLTGWVKVWEGFGAELTPHERVFPVSVKKALKTKTPPQDCPVFKRTPSLIPCRTTSPIEYSLSTYHGV